MNPILLIFIAMAIYGIATLHAAGFIALAVAVFFNWADKYMIKQEHRRLDGMMPLSNIDIMAKYECESSRSHF